MPEKGKQREKPEEKIARLEGEVARARKIKQLLQQTERLYQEQRQRFIKLSREAYFFRTTVSMPEL